MLLHNPPIVIQSSPIRQPERGIEGCQYSGYTCYWEIDFRHISLYIYILLLYVSLIVFYLLGGMSSLLFAISDIPIYTSPIERGYIIYLENSRDLPDLQKYISLCGRFIVHFYVNNTGYSNSFYACYDMSQCDRKYINIIIY